MKLNCKAGDLAVIVGDHKTHPGTAGMLCHILSASPVGPFRLPDGHLAEAEWFPSWVIELSHPILMKWNDGVVRPVTYATCPDAKLRPIRDTPGDDETLSWCDVPEGVTA